SIIGRKAMGGVMEWCSKTNHEILNSKHQTGAPPRGWGLRRRNREPTRRVGVRRTNLKVSGVSAQVSGKINPNNEIVVI
ncbi:MAG: hypothetical protein WBF55_20245, partial [Syntrophobacteria bacterium]